MEPPTIVAVLARKQRPTVPKSHTVFSWENVRQRYREGNKTTLQPTQPPVSIVTFLSQTPDLKERSTSGSTWTTCSSIPSSSTSDIPTLLPSSVIDTHNHVHFEGLTAATTALTKHSAAADGDEASTVLKLLVVMSTFHSGNAPDIHQTVAPADSKYVDTAPVPDWKLVEELACRFPRSVIPAFGIHPWYASLFGSQVGEEDPHEDDSRQDDPWWVSDLEILLRKYPSAVVGEVGLDKLKGGGHVDIGRCKVCTPQTSAKTQRLCLQSTVLKQHLDVAVRLGGRAVSVHCVQATGRFFELLQKYPTDVYAATKVDDDTAVVLRIALHSFTGTADFVKSLLALEARRNRLIAKRKKKSQRRTRTQTTTSNGADSRQGIAFEFYFGFSANVNLSCCGSSLGHTDVRQAPNMLARGKKQVQRLQSVLQVIPTDRVLVETDRGALGSDVSNDLCAVCGMLAQYWPKGPVAPAAVANITTMNALRFLRLPAASSELSSIE